MEKCNKKLKYFFDVDNKILLAYNHETEFFAKFINSTKQWEKCKISFMQFEHDYFYKSILAKEARKISKGNSARPLFEKYVEMLENNLKGIEK